MFILCLNTAVNSKAAFHISLRPYEAQAATSSQLVSGSFKHRASTVALSFQRKEICNVGSLQQFGISKTSFRRFSVASPANFNRPVFSIECSTRSDRNKRAEREEAAEKKKKRKQNWVDNKLQEILGDTTKDIDPQIAEILKETEDALKGLSTEPLRDIIIPLKPLGDLESASNAAPDEPERFTEAGLSGSIIRVWSEFSDEALTPITLHDEQKRPIKCFIQQEVEIEGQEYVVLLPADTPVKLFVWREVANGDGELEEDLIPVEDEAMIETLFPVARAVLEEENLVLQRSGFVLTIKGFLPDDDDEDEDDDYEGDEPPDYEVEDADADGAAEDEEEDDEDDDGEELQLVTTFFHDANEYNICAPLEPLFLIGRKKKYLTKDRGQEFSLARWQNEYSDANLDILTADELQHLDPILTRLLLNGVFKLPDIPVPQ